MWATIIAAISLLIAVIILFFVFRQTELLRKQVFGELYDRAQIKDLEFYLPAKQKHPVEGFDEQKEDKDTTRNSITIPVGCEREVLIRWWMVKSQTLRSFVIKFGDELKNKPKIVGRIKAFAKREISSLPREEYIDWDGNYHCEYGHARRLPKDESFVVALKVKGEQRGKYVSTVEIFCS